MLRKNLALGVVLSFLVAPLRPSAAHADNAATVPVVDVFVSGEEYPSFRIPSVVVARDGTLLAFAEGRNAPRDHAANDIVLRRSADGGQTWGELIVIAKDGDHSLNNPQAVVEQSGRILLMYQRYPQGVDEHKVVAGYEGHNICRNFLTYSDDAGLTWSEPQDVTRSTKRPEKVTSIAGGPGIGIQLRHGEHAGRIVMPFNEGPFGAWKVYAVFSDDRGETWTYGETAPDGGKGIGNEVQMVELADGALMLNARSEGGNRLRKIALSSDGGQTWSKLQDDPQLPEPQCQASILRYDWPTGDQPGHILFANPAHKTGRSRGAVRLSTDDGKTWGPGKVVVEDGFAYCCLTKLPDGDIGLLFESAGYKQIRFLRLPLTTLTEGADAQATMGK